MSAYLGILAVASAILVGSIWKTWTRYLPAARKLRRQIGISSAARELRFTLINIEVERASAAIHRPVFNPQKLALQPQTSRRAA